MAAPGKALHGLAVVQLAAARDRCAQIFRVSENFCCALPIVGVLNDQLTGLLRSQSFKAAAVPTGRGEAVAGHPQLQPMGFRKFFNLPPAMIIGWHDGGI